MSRRVAPAQLFSASKLVPFAMDASPMTATTCSFPPRRSRAAARPPATESATPACADVLDFFSEVAPCGVVGS